MALAATEWLGSCEVRHLAGIEPISRVLGRTGRCATDPDECHHHKIQGARHDRSRLASTPVPHVVLHVMLHAGPRANTAAARPALQSRHAAAARPAGATRHDSGSDTRAAVAAESTDWRSASGAE